MEFEKVTASEAVLHFEINVFPDLWPGKRTPTNKEYKRVYSIIKAAKANRVSEARARLMLEEFGGGRYRVGTSFEIAKIKQP